MSQEASSPAGLDDTLEFTGERFVPQVEGDIQLEHMHRYAVATRLVSGKRVLDIACGEGYGSNFLATRASFVFGVDIDPATIAHAAGSYQRSNLVFLQGDCVAIPLCDSCVDVVVSFETIEHLADHRRMLQEIKRVLVPGGLLLLSSPDKREYSDIPSYKNPYHVRELYISELRELLVDHFARHSLYGQRVHYGSVIAPLVPDRVPFVGFRMEGAHEVVAGFGLPTPVYLVAIASDGDLPEIPAGILLPASAPYLHEIVDLQAQVLQREERIRECQEQISSIAESERSARQRLTEAETQLSRMQADLMRVQTDSTRIQSDLMRTQAALAGSRAESARAREDAAQRVWQWREAIKQVVGDNQHSAAALHAHYGGQIAQRDAEIARLRMVETSTFWRASAPLRRLSTRLPASSRRTMRRAARLAWWSVTLRLPSRLSERRESLLAAEASSKLPLPLVQPQSSLSVRGADGPVALIIDQLLPTPDRDAGSLFALHLVDGLIQLGYHVIFAAERELDDCGAARRSLEGRGCGCLDPAEAEPIADFIAAHGDQLTLCLLIRGGAGGRFLETIRQFSPDAKIIFYPVDLHFLREERQALLANDVPGLVGAVHTRIREEQLVQECDATIVVSDLEQQLLATSFPGARIGRLPLAQAIEECSVPFDKRCGIGFIAGFSHAPNLDALSYFLTEVWPRILRTFPDMQFDIVGAGLPDGMLDGMLGNIRYLGQLPDIVPWFATICVSVAPLRYGAGAKGKVASSLAAGVPCVATSIATEGMGLADGKEVLVADTPEAFADAICRVCTDPDLWSRVSQEGLTYARVNLSVRVFRRELHRILLSVGLPVMAHHCAGAA